MAQEMLEQWKEIYDARLAETSQDGDRQYSVVRSQTQRRASVRAPPTMGRRAWSRRSEVASSLTSSQPR